MSLNDELSNTNRVEIRAQVESTPQSGHLPYPSSSTNTPFHQPMPSAGNSGVGSQPFSSSNIYFEKNSKKRANEGKND
uniref:Uncharacterized protein n=1 Tax=Fundulus heteroclitus TaxID=8078 RepID=A0A146RI08_FUNHE